MLASLVMIPVMAEENAVITNILGSREAVNVYFDNAVTVTEASVSDMEGNMFRCTYSFDTAQKRLLVKLGSLMDLTKKYILTVKTENAVYEKYLEFDILMQYDFSSSTAYTNYTMSDWGANKGGTLVSHNASHTEENLLIGSGIDSLTYSKANSGYDSWKDYTVEFDYITQTGKVANNIGIFFYSKFTYWVTQLYHGYHGIFISTDDSKTHYVKPYSNSYSNVYSSSSHFIKAFVKAMFGDIDFEGKTSVKL